MRADDPNLPYLRQIAEALGPLRDDMVFIGGSVAGLLVTDALAQAVRATQDVDAVVDASRGQFQRIAAQVAAAGFREDTDSGVICRWVHRESGVLFDLMPIQPEVLGFSNRWYRYAVDTAQLVDLGDGLTIRCASAVAFVATKLEAFHRRGKSDVLMSHDLEDVLNIVDGREELRAELSTAPVEVRATIAGEFARLLDQPDFLNALPGLLAEPDREPIVTQRLLEMSR